MENAFKGLIMFYLGAILWLISSVLRGLTEAEAEAFITNVLVYVGFFTMIIGPIWYWFNTPIKKGLKWLMGRKES